jgi:hypothetical protein
MLVPERGESILVAGRCLSAEHEAMASARVTAQCFSYGHAIGHAAALAILENISPRTLNGAEPRRGGAALRNAIRVLEPPASPLFLGSVPHVELFTGACRAQAQAVRAQACGRTHESHNATAITPQTTPRR